MPELPDIEAYITALQPRVIDATLTDLRITGVSLLKTFDPPIEMVVGARVASLRRVGKRIVLEFDRADDVDPLFLVLHLMVAGRLRWQPPRSRPPARIGLAAFSFSRPGEPATPGGTLVITEAGTTRRASLHLVAAEEALAAHDRGGVEPLDTELDRFAAELTRENRTLKRALTDPRRFSGIGNAYSDEILHAAQLSPVKRTQQLESGEVARLHQATREVLRRWVDALVADARDHFPERVTAFRDGFAVHGRYDKPCPHCGTSIQRIRYASNETNYCPTCQTGGKILADRGLSRLLKDDWPRTVDELEGA